MNHSVRDREIELHRIASMHPQPILQAISNYEGWVLSKSTGRNSDFSYAIHVVFYEIRRYHTRHSLFITHTFNKSIPYYFTAILLLYNILFILRFYSYIHHTSILAFYSYTQFSLLLYCHFTPIYTIRIYCHSSSIHSMRLYCHFTPIYTMFL